MGTSKPQREHDAESARRAETDAMRFGWLAAILAAAAVLWLTA
jgi:hypothetical protein